MDHEISSSQVEEFVDYRGRKADPAKHGGKRAASIACVVEVLENMVFLSNASNFVAYFMLSMHYPPAKSSIMVTNFMGTSFLLTIFGGFISDSFLTRFTTFIVFCTLELLGLVLLTIQAKDPELLPSKGSIPSRTQEAILYSGLYAMAAGVGGVKSALPAHGADQLEHSNKRHISTFFNWYFFCLCSGGLIACTVMVWVEENHGWKSSFTISAMTLGAALCIFTAGFPIYRYKLPGGSPLARIFKVLFSSARNWRASPTRILNHSSYEQSSQKYKFLEKALNDDQVTFAEVEETKTFFRLLPIFASTIMMNCCLAQLTTFSVQQGKIMNRVLVPNFEIPTQSLTVFPLVIMLASIPIYEQFVRFFGHKHPHNVKIFQPIRRIGIGLLLASAAMAVAALVEAKRRNEATNNGGTISVFWLVLQYMLLAASDMLTLGGMLEFFYSEAPDSMRSMSTALSWCSASMGFFFSSALVTISNEVSGKYGRAWLGGNDLNHARLDLFYILLCILNFLNFFLYVYCAKRY